MKRKSSCSHPLANPDSIRAETGSAYAAARTETDTAYAAAQPKTGSANAAVQPGADVLASYLRILTLKDLYRQGWLKRGISAERCESVADHSFGVAILALFLAGQEPFSAIDRNKAVALALVHELGEVYAGDITPADGISRQEKHSLEAASVTRVLDGLSSQDEWRALWNEYEEGLSPEAVFIKELDRLDMCAQASLYAAEGAQGLNEFFDSARASIRSPALLALLSRLEPRPKAP